jgi:type IV pilus assembly protein PilY1
MRAAFLLCLLAVIPCHADEDEAWLHRADVPAGTRPLLALLLDRSAATAQLIDAPAPFDPQFDYGAGLEAEVRCESAMIYARPGSGPAPDCQLGISLATLACDAGQASVAAHGFFVASPALSAECLGNASKARDDAHVFYSGNFLNFLQSAPAPIAQPLATVLANRLADALLATTGLDVALVLSDDDGPDGGYVALTPVANEVAAERLRVLAAIPPAGNAPLAETLAETERWLRGSDGHHSPFDSACRPVSLAVLAASEISGDAQVLAAELGTTDLRGDLPGAQSAPVAWLAPGLGHSPSDPLAGANLVAGAFQHDAAVAAGPQLSAAGFVSPDAASNSPGVILGLTAPRVRARWQGNLLRYELRAPASPIAPPVLVDRDGEPAVDPGSGLPWPHTRSFWSDAPDANLLAGGAAGRLPPADARRLQSNVAANRLLDAGNAFVPGNPRLDRATVGLGAFDPEALDDVVGWPAIQRTLGDPGLHAPLVVEDSAGERAYVLAATQDGLLHAFDAESGIEQWAFLPQELLPRLPELMRDGPTYSRNHGIDGALILHQHDPDADGRIDAAAGEHRWLLFGLGRGGSRYYALDLSQPADPRVLWSFALPDAGVEARGVPVVTRLAIPGSGQSPGDWIVLLPGGYDTRFDAPDATGTGAGDALLAVDAATGRLLWSIDGFTSLPSAPRALDLDGDGYVDRGYLMDVTGNLWRIDFASGAAAADLASARRIASLGSGAHRFFATPDASVAETGGVPRLAIAVGSGALTRPRDASVVDRVYVVFDVLAGPAAEAIDEEDLFDATDARGALPADSRGWFVRLESHDPGEKVVGSTVTFDHRLHFQTYQPLPPDAAAPCGPPRAVTRRYALDVQTALPANSVEESEEDEPDEVAATGLPPALRFGFDVRWEEPCDGCRPRPFGIAGGATFDSGYSGDPVRTSWRKLVPPPALP